MVCLWTIRTLLFVDRFQHKLNGFKSPHAWKWSANRSHLNIQRNQVKESPVQLIISAHRERTITGNSIQNQRILVVIVSKLELHHITGTMNADAGSHLSYISRTMRATISQHPVLKLNQIRGPVNTKTSPQSLSRTAISSAMIQQMDSYQFVPK